MRTCSQRRVRCPFAGAKPAPEERNPGERAHRASSAKSEDGQGDTATCEKLKQIWEHVEHSDVPNFSIIFFHGEE